MEGIRWLIFILLYGNLQTFFGVTALERPEAPRKDDFGWGVAPRRATTLELSLRRMLVANEWSEEAGDSGLKGLAVRRPPAPPSCC